MSQTAPQMQPVPAPATETSSEGPPSRRHLPLGFRIANIVVHTGPSLILLLLIVVMYILTPNFLTTSNLGDVGTQAAVVCILGIGQFFVIVTQGIDLSIGSTLSLATVTGALVYGGINSGPLVLLTMLATGVVVGLINGIVLVKWRIPHPFIVTLGMLNVASGVALLLSNGTAILGMPKVIVTLGSGYIGNIPVAAVFTAGLAVLAWLFTSRVKLGRWLYAVGGNTEGARRSGIPVGAVLITTYALSGLAAGLGAIVTAGRTNSGYPTAGLSLELDAIAAVIIGGTSFFGGRGNIGNVIVGALILAIIRNGLNLLNVSSFWQQVAIGLIIVLAVGADVLRTRLERRFALMAARMAD